MESNVLTFRRLEFVYILLRSNLIFGYIFGEIFIYMYKKSCFKDSYGFIVVIIKNWKELLIVECVN